MRTVGRNAVIGAVGLALAIFAVAPAHADAGRHDRDDRWVERSGDHKRFAYRHDDREDRRHVHRAPHDRAKRQVPPRRVVYHYRGRTVIVVPERRYRENLRHRLFRDPLARMLGVF